MLGNFSVTNVDAKEDSIDS